LFRRTNPGFRRAERYVLVACNFGGGHFEGSDQHNGARQSGRQTRKCGPDFRSTILHATSILQITRSQPRTRIYLRRINWNGSSHPHPVHSEVPSNRIHPCIKGASLWVKHRTISPCPFKCNLHNILGRSRIADDPERDPSQSLPETLHKLLRTFFVPTAETLKEELVCLALLRHNNINPFVAGCGSAARRVLGLAYEPTGPLEVGSDELLVPFEENRLLCGRVLDEEREFKDTNDSCD
jgi:hypothetical protein